jgi:hypothetical protein
MHTERLKVPENTDSVNTFCTFNKNSKKYTTLKNKNKTFSQCIHYKKFLGNIILGAVPKHSDFPSLCI